MQGKPRRFFDRHFFLCVLELQRTVVLKGGGTALPGGHLNLGDVGEVFIRLVFTMTGLPAGI